MAASAQVASHSMLTITQSRFASGTTNRIDAWPPCAAMLSITAAHRCLSCSC